MYGENCGSPSNYIFFSTEKMEFGGSTTMPEFFKRVKSLIQVFIYNVGFRVNFIYKVTMQKSILWLGFKESHTVNHLN